MEIRKAGTVDSSFDSATTLTVSQLNRQVKLTLESNFGQVWVEGEVSNFVRAASGHWYFSLKDDRAQVRCAMFRNRNQSLRLLPENGLLARVRARISLYEGRGEYQLLVEHMEAAGAGALQLAFEQLKRKLRDQGLFDPRHKQELPGFPTRVGIISSPAGAAVRDIISVFGRRFPAIELSIFPVAVQGPDSAPAICKALQWANQLQREGKIHFDALILSRGGGSMEDLWSFNDERVAHAIFDSALPVVSAVGHEIDFTIADFVADERCATPSAAAELLSPDAAEFEQQLRALESTLLRCQRRRLEAAAQSLGGLRRRLRHPQDLLRERSQRLDGLEIRLRHGMRHGLAQCRHTLRLRQLSLGRLSPATRLQAALQQLLGLQRRGETALQRRLAECRARLEKTLALLHSLSPQSTLERGYAIVTQQQGKLLRRAAAVAPGETIHTRLARGSLRSVVQDTSEEV